jgi:hypothetical protein
MILIAEQPEQRAREVLRELDRSNRLLRRQLLLAHHHPAAPKVNRGIYAFGMAGEQEGLPPARAAAQHRDLAIEPGLGAQPLHRAFGVANDLRIGNTALGAHLGGDIVGFALAGPVKEIVADRRITVMGDLAGRFAVPLIPVGYVMN